ncbi:MAG: hypothetical protein QXU67_04700 [Candidatus Bathyarchaeia archaeon]
MNSPIFLGFMFGGWCGSMLSLNLKNIDSANRGQVRIFEVIVTAIIIFTAFSASIFLIYPSRTWVLYERGDLDRLGYNILHILTETGTLESILEENNVETAQIRLKTLIGGVLSFTTYYNLTIFACVEDEGGTVWLQPLISVSNTSPKVLETLYDVSSTMTIYTSHDGKIYYLIIMLAKGR